MNEVVISKIVRSGRRTIALVISHDASLVVRAPYGVSEEYIRRLVDSKREWINKKKDYFKTKAEKFKPVKYEEGELFLFLGKKYELRITESNIRGVRFEGAWNISKSSMAQAEKYIHAWYIKNAKTIINERVQHFACKYGFKYKSIRINGARSRWGSCGPKNSLNFSWRLIMAPIEVVDCVVVHELVHTIIKNHSKKFYHHLASIIPDHREKEKWLKENLFISVF